MAAVLLKMMSFVKEADLIRVREKRAAKRDTNPIHHGLNPDQETPEFSSNNEKYSTKRSFRGNASPHNLILFSPFSSSDKPKMLHR